MADDLSREDVNRLLHQVRQALEAHALAIAETEAVRDTIEQTIAEAAGQLGEADRRAVASFAERLISAVWSNTISVDDACADVERVLAAGASRAPQFHQLLHPETGR